jgi:hypothetical protein
LSREHRTEEPKSYLDNKYSQYQSLNETSSLLSKRMKADLLAVVPDGLDDASKSSSKSSALPRVPSNIEIRSPFRGQYDDERSAFGEIQV